MRTLAMGLESVTFVLWFVDKRTAIAVESIAVVPRNSYLIRPVASARELANQIRTEPVVAQRYARHFKRSAWEFADYVEKNLRLTRLERAQTFNVYYAPPDNRLLVVRRTLPKGTPVFVEKRSGKPILKANCGNPLTPAASIPPPQATRPIEIASVATPTPVFAEVIDTPQTPTIEIVEIVDAPIEEVVAADVLPTETLVETLPESAPEPEAPPTLALLAASPTTQLPPVDHWWRVQLAAVSTAHRARHTTRGREFRADSRTDERAHLRRRFGLALPALAQGAEALPELQPAQGRLQRVFGVA
jgi:hypothetical protein